MKLESLILLAAVLLAFWLLSRRARRAQQEALAVQQRAAAGSRVVTTAGLYATVVEVTDDQVLLETAPGQQSRWDRRAIARILDETPAADPAAADPPRKAESQEPAAGGADGRQGLE